MKKTRHHLTAPPGMVQTLACEEQARLLLAYCEARFYPEKSRVIYTWR